MIYPLDRNCPTNPRVTMQNIELRNITSTGGLLPVGILRCNETNPCKNFTFKDVNVKSPLWDLLGIGWITEFVEGTATNVFPDPHFMPNGFYKDPKNFGIKSKNWVDNIEGAIASIGFNMIFEEDNSQILNLLADSMRIIGSFMFESEQVLKLGMY